MERLTYQMGNNHAVPTKFDLGFAFKIGNDAWAGLTGVLDRLAAYEDTGLTPEEILPLKESQLGPVELAKISIALNRAKELQDENATLEKALSDINDIAVEWHECGPYENANDRALEKMMQIYELSNLPEKQEEINHEQ